MQRLILALLYLTGSTLFAQAPPATASATQSSTSQVCTTEHAQPTEGERDLAREDYNAALRFYRDAVAKDPANMDARLGLVRALIGQNKVQQAQKEAAEVFAANPSSGVAEVAAGEAALRAADFKSAQEHAVHALVLAPCEGRAFDLSGSMHALFAYFASAARLFDMAHRLRPEDELIRRDWIEFQPRAQRTQELEAYLSGSPSLSATSAREYRIEADHLKAYRPGECRVTPATQSVTVPFVPIYGEGMRPVAYGLDAVFNGKKRHMQIDTGASGIMLTASAARALHLTPEYRTTTGGIGDEGDASSYLTHVASIRIGSIEISNCMVEVVEKLRLDADGLIGLDVFQRWLATLDYPNTRLQLAPLPPRPGGSSTVSSADDDEETLWDATVPKGMEAWLHTVRIGHEVLLPSAINNGTTHMMMMDTGASQTSLSLTFARESGKPRLDDDLKISGIAGSVDRAYWLDNVTLQFGRLALPPRSLPAFDLTSTSHDTGVEVSGLVGLETLSRLTITIDYRDNLVDLKYDPKHDVQTFRHF